MDRILAHEQPYDAVVLAGFRVKPPHRGREGVQEIVEGPGAGPPCARRRWPSSFFGRSYSVGEHLLQRSVGAIRGPAAWRLGQRVRWSVRSCGRPRWTSTRSGGSEPPPDRRRKLGDGGRAGGTTRPVICIGCCGAWLGLGRGDHAALGPVPVGRRGFGRRGPGWPKRFVGLRAEHQQKVWRYAPPETQADQGLGRCPPTAQDRPRTCERRAVRPQAGLEPRLRGGSGRVEGVWPSATDRSASKRNLLVARPGPPRRDGPSGVKFGGRLGGGGTQSAGRGEPGPEWAGSSGIVCPASSATSTSTPASSPATLPASLPGSRP